MLHTPHKLSEDLEGASAIGTAVHLLVQLLAELDVGPPEPKAVIERARLHVGRGRSPSARQAKRVAVSTLANVYVQSFWPLGGRLVASELVAEDTAIDLLWLLRDGTLRADELKTGMVAGPLHEGTVGQARAQAANAGALLGTSFIGVRVVVLQRPDDSFLVRPDGVINVLPGGPR